MKLLLKHGPAAGLASLQFWPALVVAGLLAGTALLTADQIPEAFQTETYTLDSGTHTNNTAAEYVCFSGVAIGPADTPIVRLRFGDYNLGRNSYLTLKSLADGGTQRLDSRSIQWWKATSALFNGTAVQVDLHLAPGDENVFVKVTELLKWCNCSVETNVALPKRLPKSLCGADGRVASTDWRVGRISGCTAWLVSNGAVLAAGHCGGASLVSGVFEVNVPASSSGGTPVAASPDDQYPIDTSNATKSNNGIGNDYQVFGLFPNSNTGLRAHVQRGFFRMSRETPILGTAMRVTGYGVDNTPAGPINNCCNYDGSTCTHPNCNSSSRTLQTATGLFLAESGAGNVVSLTYQVDTEPANSGSPIIWNDNGFAIGIHTNGGCQDDGSGSNSGTSFENDGLEAALQNFPGSNTRYADAVTYPNAPVQNGTVFQPYHTVPLAAANVPSGGRVCLVEGSFTRAAGNTGTFGADGKAYLLIAPVGTVTIGN